jgi:hypothetical protein
MLAGKQLLQVRARVFPLARQVRGFLGDRSGTSLIFTALTFPVLLGMAGLGFDATLWYMERRQNQSIADNASLAGVMALTAPGGDLAAATQAALDDAARNGIFHNVDGHVLVSQLANCGPGGASSNCLEVIVEVERPVYLASFVVDGGTVTVQARSVGAVVASGDHCILALDESMDDAVEVSGTADANIGCGVASNSSSDKSIGIYGTATMSADPAQAYGDIYVQNNATLDTNTPPQPLSQRLPDPYEGIQLPTADGGCNSNNPIQINTTVTLTPDDYCAGIKINAGADVTFEPGIYVINRGDLTVNGGATIRGDSVTFILTATSTNEVGNITINGGADVELTAPGPDGHFPNDPGHVDHGKYPGLLFIQDPAAPSTQNGGQMATNLITGGADMELTGALYFPNRELMYAGGNDMTESCVQMVARKVTMTGNSYVQNDPQACTDIGVATLAQTRVRMVE